MIVKNTDTIDFILTEIYKSKNILTTPNRACEKHYTFECVRRYLDISRHLNRRWPYTIRYLQSIHGDDILTNVFEQFDTTGNTYRNLNDAACGIFLTIPPRVHTLISSYYFTKTLEMAKMEIQHTPLRDL